MRSRAETDGIFVHKPGSKKRAAPCSLRTRLVGSKPSPSHGPSRGMYWTEGPSKASPHSKPFWGAPGGHGLEPLVSCLADSPRGSTDLVLEGLAKQFLFASFPSPMFPLFFLQGAFLPSPLPSPPPPRDCVTARHPRFCLEVCRPVQARAFQSSPAAQPSPACGAGTPPKPSREGRILCREGRLNLVCLFKEFSQQQPPAPSGPGSCWVQTKSFSWPLQRHCIGLKGPQFPAKRTQV